MAEIKALSLLKTNKTVKERAESYFKSIQRNIQKNVIDALIQKKEALEDKIFDLENFTLDTNLNAGLRTMTKEDCEKRFVDIISSEYELELINREIEIKQATFNKYFEDAKK